MLSRRLIKGKIAEVPYTNGRYIAKDDCTVVDTVDLAQLEPDSDGNIEIEFEDGKHVVNRYLVVAVSFKPLWNSLTFFRNWKVLLPNKPENELTPNDLILHPPNGGQPCPEYERLFIIPGFTRNAISKEGQVFDRELLRTGTCRPKGVTYHGRKNSPTKYVHVPCYEDDTGKSRAVGLHRLLGLALIPYTWDVDDLTINHKDGVKDNNALSNLEWMTKGENNRHAKEMGLFQGFTKVTVKDYWTGEIIEYRDTNRASLALGCNWGSLYEYSEGANSHLLYNRRYGIRLGDNYQPFDDSFDVEEQKALWEKLQKRKEEMRCWGRHIVTGETVYKDCPGDLGSYIGVHRDLMWTALERIHKYPIYGWMVGFVREGNPVDNPYLEKDIPFLLTKHGGNDFYRIMEKGSERYIESSTELIKWFRENQVNHPYKQAMILRKESKMFLPNAEIYRLPEYK